MCRKKWKTFQRTTKCDCRFKYKKRCDRNVKISISFLLCAYAPTYVCVLDIWLRLVCVDGGQKSWNSNLCSQEKVHWELPYPLAGLEANFTQASATQGQTSKYLGSPTSNWHCNLIVMFGFRVGTNHKTKEPHNWPQNYPDSSCVRFFTCFSCWRQIRAQGMAHVINCLSRSQRAAVHSPQSWRKTGKYSRIEEKRKHLLMRKDTSTATSVHTSPQGNNFQDNFCQILYQLLHLAGEKGHPTF